MNPYEMRFNYFHAARDYLQQEYQAELEKIILSYIEESQEKHDLIKALKYPTRQDIFNLADEIKNFTDKK
jgi:hypothetical protein